MEIPKDKFPDIIKQQGKSDQVDQADQELPDQVDPLRDSGLFQSRPRAKTALQARGRHSGL